MRTIAALGVATCLLAACGSQPSSGPAAGASPQGSPTSGPVHRCHHDQLASRVLKTGSTMSQPFVTIALRNQGAQACWLKGYPQVRAFGHRALGQPRRLRIGVRHGSVYALQDPGPARVTIPSHGSASFTVGTATAYGNRKDLLGITGLRVTVPRTSGVFAVPVALDASAPPNRPIPVRVTALQPSGE